MTLQMAKERRIEALRSISQDRMLVKPAAHPSQVMLPDEDTVAGYLVEALGHGCTVKQLEQETGWTKSNVIVNLYTIAKKSGFGIQRKNGKIYLVLPEGTTHIYPRPKVVAWGSTVRPMSNNPAIAGPENA